MSLYCWSYESPSQINTPHTALLMRCFYLEGKINNKMQSGVYRRLPLLWCWLLNKKKEGAQEKQVMQEVLLIFFWRCKSDNCLKSAEKSKHWTHLLHDEVCYLFFLLIHLPLSIFLFFPPPAIFWCWFGTTVVFQFARFIGKLVNLENKT